jgi:hypothetical protein
MKRITVLPVVANGFARRDSQSEGQWNNASQSLQRLSLETDRLQAIINGLRRVMADAPPGAAASASLQQLARQIEAHEKELKRYREKIQEYRDATQVGRARTGLGDLGYRTDAAARARFTELFHRELTLVAQGRDGSSARNYVASIGRWVQRAAAAERRLMQLYTLIETRAKRGAIELREYVQREASNVEQYAQRLESEEDQARLLIGEVARENFVRVGTYLRGLVLKADVGIVQQAWERREKRREKVIQLQRERARETRVLDDELREVLDDGGEKP